MITEAIREFMEAHSKASAAELALLLSKKENWPKSFIINQIIARQKAKDKFPAFLDYPDYIFPAQEALEQASSVQAAQFKASLFAGENLLDLSAGMGIDSWYFSNTFKSVDAVEKKEELAGLFKVNAQKYKPNIQVYHSEALSFLQESTKKYSLIYLDQDRRAAGKRSYHIADGEPDLEKCLPEIWKKSHVCLLKMSPMLDIQQAIGYLKWVKRVWVYSIRNECKELLFQLEKDFEEEAEIICINAGLVNQEEFSFRLSDEKQLEVDLGDYQNYIYDPNSSILKAGAFKSIAQKFKLKKISMNTHLYSSREFLPDFPGRCFELIDEIKIKKGQVKMANVISKNHPLKADAFKKKYGIKEGGRDFLLAFSDAKKQNKVLLTRLKKEAD